MTFKSEIVFVRILFPFIAGIICAYLFANIDLVYPSLVVTIFLFLILLIINLNRFCTREDRYSDF